MRTARGIGTICALVAIGLVACPKPAKPPVSIKGDPEPQPTTPTTGSVTINCEPTDAEVFVDGQRQGTVAEINAQGKLALPFGLHRFEIRHADHMTFRLELSIGEKPEAIHVKLAPRREGGT